MNQSLEARLDQTEARLERLTAQAMRDARNARQLGGGAGGDAEDSAFGMTSV